MKKDAPSSQNNNDIAEELKKRMKKYASLNFLERYSMFIGLSQILEVTLKQVLNEECGIEWNRLERWSLGTALNSLKEGGLRSDLIDILENIKDKRNYIAHDLLFYEFTLNELVDSGENEYPKNHRVLDKAILELENLMIVIEIVNKHKTWFADQEQ